VVDWWIVKRAKRNGGVYEPEMRIELFWLPAVGMVVGVFLYGLTIAKVSLRGHVLSSPSAGDMVLYANLHERDCRAKHGSSISSAQASSVLESVGWAISS